MNIDKQTFNTLDVLYDDKKWGKRIDPDEWNANFKVLEEGHNELAQKLNRQVADIDTAIQAATSSGGQNISVQYGVGTEILQDALDNVVSDINNRYTKNEVDASIGSNTNSLIANAEYNESTGVFTFTRKDGSSVVIDTVIEKVPASMALVNESDGSVSLVVTNQDGSTTKTNVTSLIEDTVINSSDTINATSVTDAVKKVTTYTLVVKPNSIGLSHIDSALTAKFEETQSAKTAAVQAKDNAVAAQNAAIQAKNNAETYASNANTYSINASISADESADSALEAKGYAEQAASYKNSAELAKVAAEKARDEAQGIVGGDYATKSYVDSAVTGLATEEYVQQNGGKIDSISVSGTAQTIDENKNVNIDLSSYAKNAALTDYDTHIADTNIHVTADEKTNWNNSVVFPISVKKTTADDGTVTYSSDKTFNQIYFAAGAGKRCLLSCANGMMIDIYLLSYLFGGKIIFTRFSSGLSSQFVFFDTGNIEHHIFYSVPTISSADNGKILSANSFGEPEWISVNSPSITNSTLIASSWDTTGTYSFETEYPNASYDIEIALDSTATSEQVEAFNGAQIVGSATSNIIKAYGDVPTVDIPIIIKVVKK